jgi:hypothetical protein
LPCLWRWDTHRAFPPHTLQLCFRATHQHQIQHQSSSCSTGYSSGLCWYSNSSMREYLVFLEYQAFSLSYDLLICLLPPHLSPFLISKMSLFLSFLMYRPSRLPDGRGGRGRSQIVRQRESLVLYNTITLLCVAPSAKSHPLQQAQQQQQSSWYNISPLGTA